MQSRKRWTSTSPLAEQLNADAAPLPVAVLLQIRPGHVTDLSPLFVLKSANSVKTASKPVKDPASSTFGSSKLFRASFQPVD